MNLDKSALLLYAVTDRTWLNGDSLYMACEKALKGGVTLLQLREKDENEVAFIKEAIEIKKLTEKYNIPLIINDNVNVMLKSGADGIHIGQDDGDVEYIRKLIGPDKILGVSIQSLDQLTSMVLKCSDYLGIGAVFSTSTKLDAVDVSFDVLKEIVTESKLPTCAIGGINLGNIHKLKNSGINGVAIVSAIFNNSDIEASSKILREECNSMFYKNNAALMIFDLDGTLLDSMSIWDDLCSKYLKILKVKNIDQDIDNTVSKLSLIQTVSYIKNTYHLTKSIDEIVSEINHLIYDYYRGVVKLKKGVKEYVLEQYNKGILLSIATASDKELVEAALKNNDILQYFSLIKTEREVQASKADSSKIYDTILEELNIPKEKTIVFEDSAHCIKTLKRNSYFTIGVEDKSCTEDIRTLCDYYIESFEEEC
ncbi:MAG: thiamine phosphate synthase [Spirochaetaceae bacterium]|nr:thiamine phosphate synthase [Spirochaetaceae bacterium]